MQTHQNVTTESRAKAELKKYPRLPCRGCLGSCKNYDHCDGKLWRMVK